MPRARDLTLKEVADDLGVHFATVLRWIHNGKVKRVTLKKNSSGHFVFRKTDLVALRRYKNSVRRAV